MRLTQPIGLSLFIGIIFLFTIVMSLVTFNPNRVAENFRKNSTFIPGIRPGEETENYLNGVIIRLSLFSAIYLSLISALRYFQEIIGLSAGITFSGTSLIILVSVTIETINQLKARDKTRKISQAKIRSIQSKSSDTSSAKGLL